MAILFILAPFLLLIILNLPFGFLRGRAAFWLTAGLLLIQILSSALHQKLAAYINSDPLGKFLSFKLSLDPLALVMLFTIGIVALAALLVARATMDTDRHKVNFINLLLTSLAGMNATVLVTDLFSLYVFIEVTALSALVLMVIEKNKFAIEGTFKYLVLSMIASIFILTAMAFFLLVCQDVSFSGVRAAFSGRSNTALLNIAAGLFLCGVFIKSGAVPFHGWVPDAYSEAQSAVSVLLAGIITKVSGVYVLMRLFGGVFTVSGNLQNVIMFTGAASIVIAALAAFRQGEIKRMLAYSSISQVGYIILALGCGTPLAYLGAVWHFFNHAVFKSLLFVNSASLGKKFGSTDIAIITGMGSQLPVTSATSLVGLLSTAGIPPLSGFWSKLLIIIALFSAGKAVYAAVALLIGVLTLAYFLFLERNIFFMRSETVLENKETVPLSLRLCEVMLAAITIAVGLAFPLILKITGHTWR
jgi:proton-translocating NADH-quinone oxidoreductase chain N